MPDPDILVDRASTGIATITLNRPRRRNACTLAMWRLLARLSDELAGDETVRAVVVTGGGGTFCAGADISEFADVRASAEDGVVYEAAVEQCYDSLSRLPKPTVAAISGYCVGGGMGLASVCDFRVADRSAEFGIPAARLGIVYSEAECRNLMALVGVVHAKQVLFSGERFGAERAAEIGFVDRLVDADARGAAHAFVQPMAENAPLSISGCKLILNALLDGTTAQQSAKFETVIAAAMDSEDYQEGVQAFAEKRSPQFRGR